MPTFTQTARLLLQRVTRNPNANLLKLLSGREIEGSLRITYFSADQVCIVHLDEISGDYRKKLEGMGLDTAMLENNVEW